MVIGAKSIEVVSAQSVDIKKIVIQIKAIIKKLRLISVNYNNAVNIVNL